MDHGRVRSNEELKMNLGGTLDSNREIWEIDGLRGKYNIMISEIQVTSHPCRLIL